MLDFILYITILFAGTGVGYLAARPYENRVIHLDELLLTLKILQAEMEYRSDPLPDLMDRIAGRTTGKASHFLSTVCQLLGKKDRYDLYESWKQAVDEVYGESALASEDKEILSQAGIELGKTDMANQHAMFAHLFKGLENQRKEADEERRKKGRIYRTLGASSGVLAVIMLL